MAQLIQNSHYVNFLRGTQAAWDKLEEKDPDTLYFISEKNATTGRLYLGNKLISSDLDGIRLENILGISEEELVSGDLLVYDDENKSWINKKIEQVVSPLLKTMVGATKTSEGRSGMVPLPAAGDQDKFLKGDGTWEYFTISEDDIAAILDKVQAMIEEATECNYWGSF